MKNVFLRSLLALLIFISLALPAQAFEDTTGAVDTYREVLEYLQKYHVDRPGLEELARGGIDGIFEALGDPYSQYISPQELEAFNESLTGEFVGVGIALEVVEGYPLVVEVFDGSPAQRAGILSGDTITAVDGEAIQNIEMDIVVSKIRGPEDTIVKLKLRREGEAEFEVSILRAQVVVPTVEGYALDNQTGYLAVKSFSSSTSQDFDAQLEKLLDGGVKNLVLDLRNNTGGLLQESVDVAENFIPRGSIVVTTKNVKDVENEFKAGGEPRALGINTVILVNGLSASASEVLAGCLQDHGAARLVGSTTFGKAVVQNVIPLDSGGALKLTTANYYTPLGRNINHQGLEPDVSVLTRELQLERALQLLWQPDELSLTYKLGQGSGGLPQAAVLNGREVACRNMPVLRDGGYLLPLRYTFEALGQNVEWDGALGGIIVKDSAGNAVLKITGGAAYDGQGKQLLGQLVMLEGVSYMPLSWAAPAGLTVSQEDNSLSLVRKN